MPRTDGRRTEQHVHRGAARLLMLFGVVVVMSLCLATTPALAASSVLFSLSDSRLDEASGIARGITSPGIYYVQNDSGDSARFFALDARTGKVRAVYTVPDAQNHDWEDLAVAPDSRGVPSVWLADIGDNGNNRAEVQLYRVDEPKVDMSRFGVAARSAAPQEWRLRYPSGPANAESLAVTPHGHAYIFTKPVNGRPSVYSVPSRPDPDRVQTVTKIGSITFHTQPTIIPANLQVLATGAALSADGATLVVRTYTEAYVWRVHNADVAAAIRAKPVVITLPLQPQGEGVCIVGGALILDSESVGSEVYRVPLPVAVGGGPTTTAAPRPSSTPAASLPSATAPGASVTPATSATTSGAARSKPATAARTEGFVGAAILVVIAGINIVVFKARRRRPRA